MPPMSFLPWVVFIIWASYAITAELLEKARGTAGLSQALGRLDGLAIAEQDQNVFRGKHPSLAISMA